MRRILFILTTLIIISCGSNEESIAADPPVREDPFLGFHITDSVGITSVIVVENRNDTTSVLISGIRKGKVWYGKFDKVTKKPIFEVEDSAPFDINKAVHVGYGEYKTFKVGDVLAFDGEQVGSTSYTYVAFREGKTGANEQGLYSCRLDFINNGKITKSLEKAEDFDVGSPKLHKWFNSIVSQENNRYFIYSPNGDLLFEAKNGWAVFSQSTPYSPSDIENCLVIAMGREEVYINRMNIKKGSAIWSTSVCKLSDGAKIENQSFDYKNGKCYISFDVLEYNGNRRNIKTTIDVETGKTTP